MHALVAALVLAALPFPAPRLAAANDRTKFDVGVVASVDAARGELKLRTGAGLFTVKVGPDVQVFDAAGKPAGAATQLTASTRVKVWYVVDGGAKAVEIAIE